MPDTSKIGDEDFKGDVADSQRESSVEHDPEELKRRLEALLFAAGRKVTIDELSNLCGVPSSGLIQQLLKEVKEEYEARDSPLLLTPETDGWKLTVREKYLDVVQRINPHTELSKQATETLSIIAWNQPIMQADVIAVRTTAAYDHIKELEEMGFITKVKHGRTFVLKITPKFFDYFDIPKKDSAKQIFKEIPQIELEAAFSKLVEKNKDAEQKKLDGLDVYETIPEMEDLEKKGMHPKMVVQLETYGENKEQPQEEEEVQEDFADDNLPEEPEPQLTQETAQNEEELQEEETQSQDDAFSDSIPESFKEVENPDEEKSKNNLDKLL